MEYMYVVIKKKNGRTINVPSTDFLHMKDIEYIGDIKNDFVSKTYKISEHKNLSKKWQDRLSRFTIDGKIPKHINLYDNGGESADRYTCCFKNLKLGFFPYLGMSSNPFHPQGVGLHNEHTQRIDYPKYAHLGKKISWNDLPNDVKCCIWQDYCDYWNIPTPLEYVYAYTERDNLHRFDFLVY
jgi:hypothetical protein